MNSTGSERDQVLAMLDNKDFSPENIKTITQFTHREGGVKYATEQMEIYKNKAIEELNGFADSEVKKSLILCAEYAGSRDF
jgi:octaprenyl-diphosphate synthase